MLQNVSESKAERYKTTHNFFVLEDGRSKSLLQTLYACSIKRNIGFEKRVERTGVAMVVLISLVVNLLGVDVHEPAMEAFLAHALIRYNQLNFKR